MDLIKNEKLVFLLCSERSGSNFITKLANNHSKICGPSTKHIINPVARNYFRYQPLHKRQNWEALIDDLLNLFNAKFSIWNSAFVREEILNNVEQGHLEDLIRYFFSKETLANNKSFCFIKEIKAYEFYPFLKSFFKESKFLYQIRDPRDMALSWKNNPTHKGGVIAAAKQWKVDQQQYLKIVELEKVHNSITIIKYEDLVSKTEIELQKLLDLLNLKFEEDMLDMQKDKITAKNAKTQKAWKNLAKPIMQNNFNKYKEQLSEKEIKFIEAICYFEMRQLGYQTEYDWSTLSQVSPRDIKELEKIESETINYEPASGVISNMKAKQRFYQHIN